MVAVSKHFIFWVHLSHKIGHGHLARSLILAKYLHDQGHKIDFYYWGVKQLPAWAYSDKFIIKPLLETGNINTPYHEREAALTNLLVTHVVQNSYFIVDDIHFDQSLQQLVQDKHIRLIMLDDDYSRIFQCDMVINPNYGISPACYQYPKNRIKKICAGSQYILAEPLPVLKQPCRDFSQSALRCHVYFGNSDLVNQCLQYVFLLLQKFKFNVYFVAPALNDYGVRQVQALVERFSNRLQYFKNVMNMKSMFLESDIAIGAPGVATWERMQCGLPSAYLTCNKIQDEIIQSLSSEGYCMHLGSVFDMTEQNFIDKVRSFIASPNQLTKISSKSSKLVDGLALQRIYTQMQEI